MATWTSGSSLISTTRSRNLATVSGSIRFTGGCANVIFRILGVSRSKLIVLDCVITLSLRVAGPTRRGYAAEPGPTVTWIPAPPSLTYDHTTIGAEVGRGR